MEKPDRPAAPACADPPLTTPTPNEPPDSDQLLTSVDPGSVAGYRTGVPASVPLAGTGLSGRIRPVVDVRIEWNDVRSTIADVLCSLVRDRWGRALGREASQVVRADLLRIS